MPDYDYIELETEICPNEKFQNKKDLTKQGTSYCLKDNQMLKLKGNFASNETNNIVASV